MKLIIDVDTGVDDAQAIMMALSHPDAEILAITCVAGNIDLDQATINTLRVLEKWNSAKPVPVFKGARRPLMGHSFISGSYHHGSDGFGGVHSKDDLPSFEPLNTSEPAASAIIRLVNQFPNEVTLVALAPLTNIALALHLDPDLGSKLKKLIIMGGNLAAKGNSKLGPTCEFNFGVDPDAAMFVFEHLGTEAVLIPWDTCQQNGINWDKANEIMGITTEKGRFHEMINRVSTERKRRLHKHHYFACDPCAMLVALDENAVLDTSSYYMTIEVNGKFTRGQTVIDWNNFFGKPTNVIVVNKLDMEVFTRHFENMLQSD